jgi:hypothetical protein
MLSMSNQQVLSSGLLVDSTLIFSKELDFRLDFYIDYSHPVIICQIADCKKVSTRQMIGEVFKYSFAQIDVNFRWNSHRVEKKRKLMLLMKEVDGAEQKMEAMLASNDHSGRRQGQSSTLTPIYRLGVSDNYTLHDLVCLIRCSHPRGSKIFYIHDRQAIHEVLISPAQARDVPLLNYPAVYSLCREIYVNQEIRKLNMANVTVAPHDLGKDHGRTVTSHLLNRSVKPINISLGLSTFSVILRIWCSIALSYLVHMNCGPNALIREAFSVVVESRLDRERPQNEQIRMVKGSGTKITGSGRSSLVSSVLVVFLFLATSEGVADTSLNATKAEIILPNFAGQEGSPQHDHKLTEVVLDSRDSSLFTFHQDGARSQDNPIMKEAMTNANHDVSDEVSHVDTGLESIVGPSQNECLFMDSGCEVQASTLTIGEDVEDDKKEVVDFVQELDTEVAHSFEVSMEWDPDVATSQDELLPLRKQEEDGVEEFSYHETTDHALEDSVTIEERSADNVYFSDVVDEPNSERFTTSPILSCSDLKMEDGVQTAAILDLRFAPIHGKSKTVDVLACDDKGVPSYEIFHDHANWKEPGPPQDRPTNYGKEKVDTQTNEAAEGLFSKQRIEKFPVEIDGNQNGETAPMGSVSSFFESTSNNPSMKSFIFQVEEQQSLSCKSNADLQMKDPQYRGEPWGCFRSIHRVPNLDLLFLLFKDLFLDDEKASSSKVQEMFEIMNKELMPDVSQAFDHSDLPFRSSLSEETTNVHSDEDVAEMTESFKISLAGSDVNSDFVEGLDDLYKFFEGVDPPDELDVGASGLSMQELLVGKGQQILVKKMLKLIYAFANGWTRLIKSFGVLFAQVRDGHEVAEGHSERASLREMPKKAWNMVKASLEKMVDLVDRFIDSFS